MTRTQQDSNETGRTLEDIWQDAATDPTQPRLSLKDLFDPMLNDIERYIPAERQDAVLALLAKAQAELTDCVQDLQKRITNVPKATIELLIGGAAADYATKFMYFGPIMGRNQGIVDQMQVEFGDELIEELFSLPLEKTTLPILPMVLHTARCYALEREEREQNPAAATANANPAP
jgi:hypothetical protein